MPDANSLPRVPPIVNGRYEIKTVIGQGGMGVVYQAYDTVTKRAVALKTMWGHVDPAALELFEREWTVLARLSHPSIVDILDTGEFQENNQRKPYFVMPLLPGKTLDQLLKSARERLTVERSIDIMWQVCRGLQAAHDHGLVHRDLKPSNIFVLNDDTVKIIDFGVVHLADARSVTGLKGTLQYMAPEQIEMKPATPLSDIFSLGVVCYEILSGRKPFARPTEADTAEAIRRFMPPPVCDINPAVNQALSRTVHKALAKQPWHRFSTAREFGETLLKALRNEPIERFDLGKYQPRIERIKKAYNDGDLQFAMEILCELESEGHLDAELPLLHIQIEQGLRHKTIQQLLDGARTRIEEEEYPLALQKIQEVLALEPQNAEALGLKRDIEQQRSERQIENWLRIARQHLENQLYNQARQAVQEVLKLDASDTKARQLLADIERQEQETAKAREKKQKLYESALESYKKGEISTALSKLERVLALNSQRSDSAASDREATYQSLYNQIRSERDAAHNAYAEGRAQLANGNVTRALELCEQFLQKRAGDPMFQALKIEAEEMRRQQESAAIAEMNSRIEAEPDPEKKYALAKEAVEKYPQEMHFKSSLKLIRERRDLIASIVARARQYEERGQLNDAAGQWDILRTIYPAYPGLDFEIERLWRRREEQIKEEGKARWLERIDRHFAAGEYEAAGVAITEALREFPADRELESLGTLAAQAFRRSTEAKGLLDEASALLARGGFDEATDKLRKAIRLDERNVAIRAALLGALEQRARALVGSDWRAAEPLVKEALAIDGSDPIARSLAMLIEDYRRQDKISHLALEIRNLQAAGSLSDALRKADEAANAYPNEGRFVQLQNTLRAALAEKATFAPGAVSPHPSPPARLAEPISSTPSATVVLSAAATSPETTSPSAKQPPAEPVCAAEQKPQRPLPARKGRAAVWGGGIAALAALIAAGILGLPAKRGSVARPTGSSVPVQLSANVSGAAFNVDGQPASASLSLKPGKHVAVATAPGYIPATKSFNISTAAKSLRIELALSPALPQLRVASDLKDAKLIIDGEPPVDLADGSASKDDIGAGMHRVKIAADGKDLVWFDLRIKPGVVPELTSPVSGTGAHAVIITSLGGVATVYASPGIKAAIGDSEMRPVAAAGMPLPKISSADAKLMVADGSGKGQAIPIDVTPVPVISVILNGAKARIPVMITANVPDAVILLNGKPLKKPMANGSRVLPLEPGKYQISVTHDGYRPATEQTVEIQPGTTSLPPLNFTLTPEVRYATLSVDGAPASTEVWIDGTLTGQSDAHGAFTRQIPAGTHSVSLRKPNYEQLSLTRDFQANQTVRIAGAEMQPYGSIALHIIPAEAKISYQREGASSATGVLNAQTLSLPQGRYSFTAEADGYKTHTESVAITPGQETSIRWTLDALQKPHSAVLTPASIFENGGLWSVQSGWWVHDAKGYSFLRQRQGTFTVLILKDPPKGFFHTRQKKIDFVGNYTDEGNHLAYTLDSHSLTRRVIQNGHTVQVVRVPLTAQKAAIFQFKVELNPDAIVIRNSSGQILDTVKGQISAGKFGFEDEIALVVR
jgi:serine/threonine protein kinase